ncbi:hypothetical protein ZOD2009_01575 [Haladaptatus paucihalophilus DX253]|uniref:DUF424 domain-containing protein n=1 Tax=Haladaptatus paucihalophilus DX253 TaxID=797209 RepID=E7QMZ7_HALPU|nr:MULTISPECIES: DUF424 family protein [Haladaptatus]EFW93792.1 hypothetical protein ZOD2009_01575 [Haladaptatus paucihalophilus DX253]ODR81491.1 hypothetical protein BG842_04075 [Haladaptatus sp. W1]GKZ15119.1 hypothetical protein HAL_30000 [Haladaptatus sp. T7]SHL51223.1 hypothetical protein SAMN05444342_4011 [Haladaptatus paucihalophilus DX253]
MILKERETGEGLLVAVCDDDVLGETFETGEMSFTVTEEFYGGDEADEDEVVHSLNRADVANIVGTDAVALAVEAGFVNEANVLELDSTRHAQFLRM